MFGKKKDDFMTPEQHRDFCDGFATTYPLRDQPRYPVHASLSYLRGLFIGARTTLQHGLPDEEYEESELHDE